LLSAKGNFDLDGGSTWPRWRWSHQLQTKRILERPNEQDAWFMSHAGDGRRIN